MILLKIFRTIGLLTGLGAIIAHLTHYPAVLDPFFDRQRLNADLMTAGFFEMTYQYFKIRLSLKTSGIAK